MSTQQDVYYMNYGPKQTAKQVIKQGEEVLSQRGRGFSWSAGAEI